MTERTIFDGPNGAAIRALADHYCIQRDPRRTAKVIADINSECARRLCEGNLLIGFSLECEVWETAHDWKDLKREDLVAAAAALVELIALWDLGPPKS